jgi:tetratricopeptide (TPR) repeat protein
MSYSQTYLLYPYNKALERSIAYAIAMLSEDLVDLAMPDTKVAVADNFLHTRGNYEQNRFSSKILESAREAFEVSQNSLANIYAAMGQQLRNVELYAKAIQCFDYALEELNQEKSPLAWAETQYNLGTAKQALGRQESDSTLLKAAIDAYTNALLVWSRKEMPDEWASAMHQLGATFHTYGKLLKGNRTFQKSVVAYKNALAELDADNYAFELVATHNNCGAVLHHLAESEASTDRLEEAIRSYETALTVCMEQQLPIHLAVICRVNKFTARRVLAELTKDASVAEEVADEFEVIIECFAHALQPLCLRHCKEQMNMAKSLAPAMSA